PAQTGPGGFTRSGVTLEGDVNNNSGTDAVAAVGATAGNYIAGVSQIANGINASSTAYNAGSSVTTSGKGFRAGFVGAGLSDVGAGIYNGGVGPFSPTYDFVAQSTATVGFVCGKGTAATAQGIVGNPATCMLVDALGTTGNSETVNSGIIAFRAKNASTTGTDWQIQHVAGDALRLTLIGAQNYFKFGNTGHLIFSGAASQHIDTFAANNDISGVLTCAASTVTKTFATAYTSTPVIGVSDETTTGGARVSAKSASAFTVTCTGATDTLDYFVHGNPN
ncbi:MAG TPA: hypothetical protein VIK39_03415, partial [Candidatus Angelobacter sp.]